MSSSSDIEQFVHQLSNQATRENALLELSKKRENFPELAPYLWYSFGTIAALLQVGAQACWFLLLAPCLSATWCCRSLTAEMLDLQQESPVSYTRMFV